MKTLEKYQLNRNPKCVGSLPFRTETGLEILLICKQRRAQRLLERLIICCLKGIKVTIFKSCVPIKMGDFIQNSRFLRVAIQSHTLYGVSSESWPEFWYLVCGCRDVQGLPLPQPDVSSMFSPHRKVKACEHFSYSILFREPLLLRNSCYFSLREGAVSAYYFLLVMETWLGSSIRIKRISQLFFIYLCIFHREASSAWDWYFQTLKCSSWN